MNFSFECKTDLGLSSLQNGLDSVHLTEDNEWKYQDNQRMIKNSKSKTPPSPADSGVVSDQSETSSSISSIFETAANKNNLNSLDSSNVPFYLNETKKYGNTLPCTYGNLPPFWGDSIWSNTSKYQSKNFPTKNDAPYSLWKPTNCKPSYDRTISSEVYSNNINKESSLRNNGFSRSVSLQSGYLS